MFKFSLPALVFAALPAFAQPQPALNPRPAAPEGTVIERDIAYLGEGRTEKADLYLPAKRGKDVKSPAVVIIHGGGWTGGTKNAAREFNIGTTLALNGYVGFSIDYILATKDKPTWPANLHDCKNAVRWLRKNAGRLQIDPENIGVIGGSAGGHLAAMLALTGPADKLDPPGEGDCRVKCAVDLYGPADLINLGGDLKNLDMIGKTLAEAPELYKAASPITYADKNDPPILIIHGTADKIVDVKQSHDFAAALKKLGAPHELVIVEGAPHTFHLQPKERDLRPVVLGFFDKSLKAKK
jgi:acetyl esterase/lipase